VFGSWARFRKEPDVGPTWTQGARQLEERDPAAAPSKAIYGPTYVQMPMKQARSSEGKEEFDFNTEG
jgi:hypothetical protein